MTLLMFREHLRVSFFWILTRQHIDDLSVFEKDTGWNSANIIFYGSLVVIVDVHFVDFDFALQARPALVRELYRGRTTQPKNRRE
jgi:hypothetical protein